MLFPGFQLINYMKNPYNLGVYIVYLEVRLNNYMNYIFNVNFYNNLNLRV